MKTKRTASILIIIVAQVLQTEPSPVSPVIRLGLETVQPEDGVEKLDIYPTHGPPLGISDEEEWLQLIDDTQQYYKTVGDNNDNASELEEDESARYHGSNGLVHQLLASLDRERNAEKRLNDLTLRSKKRLHRIMGIAGFAIFILTCVITFICGLLACCGKLDVICFRRRHRSSTLEEDHEVTTTNHDEGLLDYYPEYDCPPAYSDLYSDTYKHESAHLNPRGPRHENNEKELQEQDCDHRDQPEPETPPPLYSDVT